MSLINTYTIGTPTFAGIFAEEVSYSVLVAQIIGLTAFFILLFLFKKRFLKISCACGMEVMLWLISKTLFGTTAIITQIFTWFTAAAAIIIVIALVNRIDWNGIRRR